MRKTTKKNREITLTEQFNLIFGTYYNREKIRKHCGRYLGLISEQTRQQYQKQLPLYSERYNAKDDVIDIKVCNEIGKCKWIPKHHYIWELETGSIINLREALKKSERCFRKYMRNARSNNWLKMHGYPMRRKRG